MIWPIVRVKSGCTLLAAAASPNGRACVRSAATLSNVSRLVLGVALGDLDQVLDQIEAPLQLHFDVRPRLVDRVAGLDERVERQQIPQHDDPAQDGRRECEIHLTNLPRRRRHRSTRRRIRRHRRRPRRHQTTATARTSRPTSSTRTIIGSTIVRTVL